MGLESERASENERKKEGGGKGGGELEMGLAGCFDIRVQNGDRLGEPRSEVT